MRLKFIKDAVNQENGEGVKAGTVIMVGEMEGGRHLAEGNAVPVADRAIETAVAEPPEDRKILRLRRGRS